MPKNEIVWTRKSEDGDLEAALDFLSLVYTAARARALVKSLRSAPVIKRTAKDLLRASGLPLLPADETRVKGDLKKIAKRKSLAPVLLVTGDMSIGVPLVVADGYHRICAACHFDEDSVVYCRMVDSPPVALHASLGKFAAPSNGSSDKVRPKSDEPQPKRAEPRPKHDERRPKRVRR
jgi:hypothetical protein